MERRDSSEFLESTAPFCWRDPDPEVLMIYNADNLSRNWDCETQLSDGAWVLARPMRCASLWVRLRVAWGVFIGRYDALSWTGQ